MLDEGFSKLGPTIYTNNTRSHLINKNTFLNLALNTIINSSIYPPPLAYPPVYTIPLNFSPSGPVAVGGGCYRRYSLISSVTPTTSKTCCTSPPACNALPLAPVNDVWEIQQRALYDKSTHHDLQATFLGLEKADTSH